MKKLIWVITFLFVFYPMVAVEAGFLKADSGVTVAVGPFTDVGDGFTPQTDITLGGNEAELLKCCGAATVDISARNWAAITNVRGWYHLGLTAADTDTEGTITIVIQDDSDCLPVFMDFTVVNANVYDSLYAVAATDYLQTDALQIEATDATDQLDTAAATVTVTDIDTASLVKVWAYSTRELTHLEDTTTTVSLATSTIGTVENVPAVDVVTIETVDATDALDTAAATVTVTDIDTASLVLVWAYSTRELTHFDEDTTTIDIDGTTVGTVTTLTTTTGFSLSSGVTLESVESGVTVRAVKELVGHTVQTGDLYVLYPSGVTVIALAANVITAASIATDAFTADEFAQSGVSEFWTTTLTPLGVGAPSNTPTGEQAVLYPYTTWRNKFEQESSGVTVYEDDGATVLYRMKHSDDGTTYTKEEWITP